MSITYIRPSEAVLYAAIEKLEKDKAELLEALKSSEKELQACQAVIHLCGGFDPAYVRDAQAALKQARAVIARTTGEKA